MLVFEERGKPEFPEKNLSEQSREPTTSMSDSSVTVCVFVDLKVDNFQ